MKVMVTGHLGYIGTLLTQLLKAEGHDVVGYDAGLYRNCAISEVDPIPYVEKDIRDAEVEDFEGVEAVIHLAGLSNDPLGAINPEMTYMINHKGSVRVAEMARRAGASRMVFASSCSVYGQAGETLLTEESPYNPVTPYAESKLLAEGDISALADDNFSPVFLRPATAYGVSPMIRFDLVLNNLVAWASATKQVYLKSDGTAWRPLAHAQDIARAAVAAVQAPKDVVHCQAFNVGVTNENFRVRELAEIVEDVVPGAATMFAGDASPDKRHYRVSFEKIARELPAFRPQWTVHRGAVSLFETISAMGLSTEDFEGPRYNRLDHLQMLLSDGRLGPDMRYVVKPEEGARAEAVAAK